MHLLTGTALGEVVLILITGIIGPIALYISRPYSDAVGGSRVWVPYSSTMW